METSRRDRQGGALNGLKGERKLRAEGRRRGDVKGRDRGFQPKPSELRAPSIGVFSWLILDTFGDVAASWRGQLVPI